MSSLWDWLRARAVEIHVAEHLRQRLERGDRLRVKLGMDPTAPDLHLGHLVVLDVLRAFQDEGHTVVLIVGDYTAMIGDPSGRSETRPMLSREQVDANAQTYLDQVHRVLEPGRPEVRRNSEWLGEMRAADILRLMATQTLQSVLQREDFTERLQAGAPIGAHEILYPFSQAYDSVAVRADVEIGGTDQLFNLLFGREVQRAYGQESQDVAVFPLLEGLDGVQKMSKSLANYIALTDAPEQVYGKTMKIPDAMIPRWLGLVSGLEPERIPELLALPPRDAKAALARQLVKRLHGEAPADRAEADFEAKFRRRDVVPEDLPEHRPSSPADLIGTLVELGWYPTRSQAKRVIEQGGLSADGHRVGLDHVLHDGEVLKAGKKNFVRIRVG